MKEILLAATLARFVNWYDLKVHALVRQFGSLEKTYDSWRNGDIKDAALLRVLSKSWNDSNLCLEAALMKKYDIQAVVYGGDDYPVLLETCDDAPYVLFYYGDISLASSEAVSCIGTRSITAYGRRSVGRLIGGLRGHSLTIVSGLALGIDAEAHRAALDAGLPTIAVLGGGLDRFEPITNHTLAERILNEGGLIVSEYPHEVRPQKGHFLARNRIIAGLTRTTVVIEGKEHSGSLVTARLALRYGRDVATVPGDIFIPTSQAPHQLIRDGAWPIMSEDDFLSFLNLKSEANEAKSSDPFFALLSMEPRSLEELSTLLALSLDDIRQRVLELEIDGRIQVTEQGKYCIT